KELIALLLGSGTRSESVLDLANRVLMHFEGLKLLRNATIEELTAIKGIGPARGAIMLAALGLGERLTKYKPTERYVIRSPEDGADYVMEEMRTLDQEHFIALYLNTTNQIIHSQTNVIGTVNSSVVHPREIFREAVRRSSASLIVGHIGMKNQWRNYNLLYPQCYINFAFFLMAKLSLKVVMSLLVLSTAGSHLVFTN